MCHAERIRLGCGQVCHLRSLDKGREQDDHVGDGGEDLARHRGRHGER